MYRILLVDDEINVLSALKREITTIPVEDLDGERPAIETFASARAALNRINEVPVDLVIADYRMPEMNGVEFLSKVIEQHPDVARLILSGYTDLDGLIGAINRVQISHFIKKPWNDFELKSAITQSLATRALVQENLRLAHLVNEQQSSLSRQQAELLRLEEESPGITRIQFAEDGGIVLDEDDV
ncbi:MAG: response regulator [Rudaea sp.]